MLNEKETACFRALQKIEKAAQNAKFWLQNKQLAHDLLDTLSKNTQQAIQDCESVLK